VIVANHASWLDPFILPLVMARKPAVLAMTKLWRTPGVGLVMRMYGRLAIPLRRGAVDTQAFRRGAVDTRAFRRALAALQDDRLLIVFPEGGITPDGTLRPFQRGAALLAARADAPLLPVALIGTGNALPLGRIVPRRRRITVRVGVPISVAGGAREELDRVTQEAAAQIRALLAAG